MDTQFPIYNYYFFSFFFFFIKFYENIIGAGRLNNGRDFVAFPFKLFEMAIAID